MDKLGDLAANQAQSWRHLTRTLNDSRAKIAEATSYAKLLLGCYRTGEANDPEVYTAAIIAVLSDYPPEVMREVVDPRGGIPSKIQWLPSPAEVKKACEDIAGPQRRFAERQADAERQLAERDELDRLQAAESEEHRKSTYERAKTELAAHGMYLGDRDDKNRISDRPWTRYTDAQLLAIYPPQAATHG